MQCDAIDILIDDGGHTPTQQRVTLEQMLPHIRPRGIYVCEDIHGLTNASTAFATNLVNELNQADFVPGKELTCASTPFQQSIHSIHFYPYAMVIEKHHPPATSLCAPQHGTEWQPFYKQDP
jgi:hypothetical protein